MAVIYCYLEGKKLKDVVQLSQGYRATMTRQFTLFL